MKKLLPYIFFLTVGLYNAIGQSTNYYQLNSGIDYKPGALIFKLLTEHRQALCVIEGQPKTFQLSNSFLHSICSSHGEFTVKLLYPHHLGRSTGKVDLTLIGEFEFSGSISVPDLCYKLMATGMFEYVEPRFLYKTSGSHLTEKLELSRDWAGPLFTPNDPMFDQQWHLGKISASAAWDVEKGDSSVMIGIVDTGVKWDHPDLAGNLAFNYADPMDSLDNDGNGYIDDYYGWDFFNDDNTPDQGNAHGTFVAGVAAAVTNNGIGLASPGFDCRFVPVKVGSDDSSDNLIYYGYEGIVYAAERGCKIINCSWGGPGFSAYGQDIVNKVTNDFNALVISGIGNSNNEVLEYPGAYEYVLNGTATNQSDQKQPTASFNYQVEISAPSGILIPNNNDGYSTSAGGGSFASPQIAGAAALLAAQDTTLTGLQIGQKLRITADNIDDLNPDFAEKLGNGRLNMYNALTNVSLPAVRFSEADFSDGNDSVFSSGDTISLSGVFTNYLADVADLIVTISSPQPEVTFLNETFSISSLSTLSEESNAEDPFRFVLDQNIPPDTEINLRLGYQASGYDDYQWLIITVNTLGIDINNGKILTTVFSNGRIGYRSFWGEGEGKGFQYLNAIHTDGTFGLMLGNASVYVSDAALESWNTIENFSDDFQVVDQVRHVQGSIADIAVTAAYNDQGVTPPFYIMDLFVRQKVYTWLDDNFIISQYEITNNSENIYDSFHVGLWSEVDIHHWEYNRVEQDSTRQMGYAYNTQLNGPYIGVQLLDSELYNLYAIEYSETYGGVDITDAFDNPEKYTTLTESRPSAGFDNPEGAEISMVVGTGPFVFLPGETIMVAYAIHAADNLEALQASADQAVLKYGEVLTEIDFIDNPEMKALKIYPNPTGDIIQVEIPEGQTSKDIKVELYDLSGKQIYSSILLSSNKELTVDTGYLTSGIYLLRLGSERGVSVGKFVKQ